MSIFLYHDKNNIYYKYIISFKFYDYAINNIIFNWNPFGIWGFNILTWSEYY